MTQNYPQLNLLKYYHTKQFSAQGNSQQKILLAISQRLIYFQSYISWVNIDSLILLVCHIVYVPFSIKMDSWGKCIV